MDLIISGPEQKKILNECKRREGEREMGVGEKSLRNNSSSIYFKTVERKNSKMESGIRVYYFFILVAAERCGRSIIFNG